MWDQMPNVIVTLKGSGPANAKNALLYSAHFDTATLSPGATDNTMAVACLLEVLEVLAHSAQGTRDFVAAFVNGEESGLLGAHHMTTDNITYPGIGSFINLDGTPGDKSILFRTTGGWMDYMYMAAPHPLGFSAGQDIFNLGLIKSDTDWSVYKITRQGLDFATFSHRQSYHTQEDTTIVPGAPQFLGDNLLAIALKIISLERDSEVERKTPKGEQHVFFSFLNSGFAVYTRSAAIGIHVTITLLLFITLVLVVVHRIIRWKDAFQFAAAPPLRILGLGTLLNFVTFLFILVVMILGMIFTWYFARWFAWGNTKYGVWAFVFPAMTAFISAQWLIMRIETHLKVVVEVSRLQLLWGNAVLMLLLLIATLPITIKGIGSTYLVYLSCSTVFLQLIIQHVFYILGYMSDDKSDYIPLASDEHMTLLSRNAMGYSAGHNVVDEQEHVKTHEPKVDSKTTHFMWLIIFIVGVAPLIFFTDIIPLLFALASGSIPTPVFAGITMIIVYLIGIHFMMATRRAGHLGVVAIVLLIVSIAVFFSLTMIGRTNFHRHSPYPVFSNSTDGSLTVTAIENFYPSITTMLNKLPEFHPPGGKWVWLKQKTSHKVVISPARPMAVNTRPMTCQQLPSTNTTRFQLTVMAENSQFNKFYAPGSCSSFSITLPGQTITWDRPYSSTVQNGRSPFEILLHNPTLIGNASWSVEFSGPPGRYDHHAGWTDPAALVGYTELANSFKKAGFISFFGLGSPLHWKTESIITP